MKTREKLFIINFISCAIIGSFLVIDSGTYANGAPFFAALSVLTGIAFTKD